MCIHGACFGDAKVQMTTLICRQTDKTLVFGLYRAGIQAQSPAKKALRHQPDLPVFQDDVGRADLHVIAFGADDLQPIQLFADPLEQMPAHGQSQIKITGFQKRFCVGLIISGLLP